MGLVEVVLIGAGLSTLACLVCGVFVAAMAQRRGGRTVPWILLGPIGLYMILKVMDHHFPECRVPVLRGVRNCPTCGAEITRLENNPVGPMWTYRRDW